jgi:hypothetical protein
MAIAVVGGLSFALVLALFFVPYTYLVTKGMRNRSNDQMLTSSPLFDQIKNNEDMPPTT